MDFAALDLSRKSNSPSEKEGKAIPDALKQLLPQLLSMQEESKKRKVADLSADPVPKKSKTESSGSPLDLSFKSGDVEVIDTNTSDSGNHSGGDEQGKLLTTFSSRDRSGKTLEQKVKRCFKAKLITPHQKQEMEQQVGATKPEGGEIAVWRLPIPELSAQSKSKPDAQTPSLTQNDEKLKNLIKVVQILRHVQNQKITQGKLGKRGKIGD